MSERWLDPGSEEPDEPTREALDENWIRSYSSQLISESLVAQRLLLARSHGLALGRSNQGSTDLTYWGHSLASAVAVLLPPPPDQQSAERRARRKRQEQLLKGQARWPDLASPFDTTYLLCADGHPPETGLPHQLYPRRAYTEVLDFDGFDSLVKTLMAVVSPSIGPAWIGSKTGLSEALTTIISETFRNTHDHARQEVDRSNVRDSVRGIFARFYSMKQIADLAVKGEPHTHSPALRYARNFLPRQQAPGVRPVPTLSVGGLLELSILDSGPGMAAKWLGRDVGDVPVQKQLDAVMECFEKGRTTTGTQGRGYGLAKVLLKLKELHGFMAVRSNQIHVYRQFAAQRDFASTETADGMTMPDPVFLDWRRGVSKMPSACRPVRGTLISFLLPMEG